MPGACIALKLRDKLLIGFPDRLPLLFALCLLLAFARLALILLAPLLDRECELVEAKEDFRNWILDAFTLAFVPTAPVGLPPSTVRVEAHQAQRAGRNGD